MKKIITLLSFVGILSLQGCTVNDTTDYVDHDTISVTYENKVPYDFTLNNQFSVRFNFPTPILKSDMVLVYRLGGVNNGRDVWEFLPETYYFVDGTRNFSFNYNFTNNYVDIYLDGNDLTHPDLNDYRFSQTFRIVVVPADLIIAVDKNNYFDVINKLNVNENQIQKINF